MKRKIFLRRCAGVQPVTVAAVNHCLSCLDQITVWLNKIETDDAIPADTEAKAALPMPVGSSAHARPASAPAVLPDDAIELLKEQVAMLSLAGGTLDPGFFGKLGAAGRVCRNVLHHFGMAAEAADIETALALLKAGLTTPEEVAPVVAEPPTNLATERDPPSAAARSLRVDVWRIEEIVKITGELIVVKNAIGHGIQSLDGQITRSRELQNLHARLDRLTAELLRSVLATRVLPLTRVFQRFPRLVREMAARLNKQVLLVTEGETTEADKVIVEALFEPLLHVLRNAVDHGIEPGPRRQAAGKPETACITLRGRREGDRVVVEVEDDGGGIDLAAIRDTAIRRRLTTQEAAGQMPDAEILNLIFLPGFSTAPSLSDISGRGVGMDAVRAAIERLGGRVVLNSRKTTGTLVSFIMPFTVMMTRVLTLRAGGQRFGVPFDDLVETVQLPVSRLIPVGGTQAIILHGRTVPVVGLAQILGLDPIPAQAGVKRQSDFVNLAVVSAGDGEWAALEVDGFGGQLEIILKPLEGLLAGISGIAGTTLLGNGEVLVVLELRDLLG
jgi:two-component system chemotaxis sensor kinase CheA